jgi:hypothetical protein
MRRFLVVIVSLGLLIWGSFARAASPPSDGFESCTSGVFAAMNPCVASPGATIEVRVNNPNRIYTALIFTLTDATSNGRAPSPAISAPLVKKGLHRYATTLPLAVCAGHRGPRLYDVHLAGALGIWLDRLGVFEVDCAK